MPPFLLCYTRHGQTISPYFAHVSSAPNYPASHLMLKGHRQLQLLDDAVDIVSCIWALAETQFLLRRRFPKWLALMGLFPCRYHRRRMNTQPVGLLHRYSSLFLAGQGLVDAILYHVKADVKCL
ncbi:hypothetical protein NL676_016167 [Syzygium grande]|nr:hypothetical protein NL676_016167 [Syzygium grande]